MKIGQNQLLDIVIKIFDNYDQGYQFCADELFEDLGEEVLQLNLFAENELLIKILSSLVGLSKVRRLLVLCHLESLETALFDKRVSRLEKVWLIFFRNLAVVSYQYEIDLTEFYRQVLAYLYLIKSL